MAASTYDDALARVLAHEGGYSNHPADPGGPTNFGITIADYRRYVKPRATAADVRAMTLAEAKAIYRSKYWEAMCCDELPAGVDYAIFDYGVNSGTSRAAKVLERIIGSQSADGKLSAAELVLVGGSDAATLIAAICDERLAFLKGLKTWPVFGKGWERRVAEVRAGALAMAKGSRRAKPGPTRRQEEASGKGVVPVNGVAQKASAGAVVLAGTAAVHEAHAAGFSAAGIATLVAGTIVVATALWLFWRWRQQQWQHAPATAPEGLRQ